LRSAKTPEDLREIDAAFLEKLRAIAAGDELGVTRWCDIRG